MKTYSTTEDSPSTDYGLTRRREKPNVWFDNCAKKLHAIARLDSNWDSYGAMKPDSLSLNYANAFLHLLRDKVGVSEPAISPHPNGNVVFEWDTEDRFIVVEIDAAGRCSYYLEALGVEAGEDSSTDFSTVLHLITRL